MELIDVKHHSSWRYFKGHPETRIQKTAKIYGNAEICDTAWVFDNAKVYGNARVCGKAEVCGDAKVSGNAHVSGDAIVSGNGEIFKTEDYMVIQSPNQIPLTLHRDKEIGIRINYFDFSGTLQEYIFRHSKLKNQYFHQVMIPKYYETLKDRMTPLEEGRE